MKTIPHIALALHCLAYMALAETVKLAWDANPAAEKITSYVVSYGPTVAMTQSLTVTTNAATTPDLAPGVYYFAVRAVNERGTESPKTASITHTALPTPTAPMRFRIDISLQGTVTLTPTP